MLNFVFIHYKEYLEYDIFACVVSNFTKTCNPAEEVP